jgi:amino acid adenylation domain-containing protein
MLTYDVERDRTESYTTIVPVGRPLDNTQAYTLDRWMQPSPIGVGGELYIGGLCVARGYLNHPEITAEKFIPDLYGKDPGARLYKTGDQVRLLPDGNIEFLGRLDRQVKIRGFRIELGEIESALLQHEAIREAVVIAGGGEGGDKRLVAYLTARNGDSLAQGELRSYLKRRLPDYMTPAAFVVMEKLPLMSNGKLDRRALPAPDIFDDARQYEPPIGMGETTLARVWAEILDLERVSRNDNFFELGGHSLLAIKLIERMRQEGLRANVRALFTSPTLSAFAAMVKGQNGFVEVPPNRIPAGCEVITSEMLPLAQLSAAEIERVISTVPGGSVNVQDIYPLAPLQEGILFHYLLETNRDPYLGWGLYRFDTRSRLDGFLQALQSVIDRHDILRTAVQWDGLPEPLQVVWRQASLAIEEVGFDAAAGDVGEQLRFRFDPRHYKFDISRAPMMRAFIASAGPGGNAEGALNDGWLMLLLYQHMIVDHVTMDILLKEIQAHLLGRVEGLPTPLPFRNFVAQARLGVSHEEHESFFRKMLGDVDEPTAPYGLIDARDSESGVKEARREVDAGLADRLRRTSRALGVSPASLCHLAWARVLGRLSGRDDVVFGTILFGRMQGGVGVDRAPGMFINTLPIRIRVGAASVEESVRQTHQLLTDLMRHEHASLALAQRCSAAPGPLFSALLNYRHSLTADDTGAEAGEPLSAWEGIELLDKGDRTNYPLVMSVDDWGRDFTLNAQAAPPIDPDRICAYLHTALERLEEMLARSPSTPARDLDVAPDSERYQLLIEWNTTQAEFPPLTCLQHLFEEQANQTPDNVAVVYDESYLSYAELNGRANQLARHLRELGVGPEVKVGICLERSTEMVVGLLGALKAGGAYAPMDTTYPDARLKLMIEDADLQLILTQGLLAGRFSERSANVICLDRDWRIISEKSSEDLQTQTGSDNAAYVIFTSGSTGRPKGALVTHRSVLNLFNAIDAKLHFSENDVWTMFHSYSFDFSVWEMWGALIYGGTLVVVPHAVTRAPDEFYELVDEKGVTILSQTPSAFRHFIKADEAAGASRDLSLRAVIFGGEALEFQMLKGWLNRRGDESPQLINMYGITETTVHTTYKKVTSEDLKEACGSVIGKPLANIRLYLFSDQLQPAPPGVAGELYVAGEGMARGYTVRGELTADRFRPAPYGRPGERIYKTGDLARYLSDGNIEYLGRKDDQVKIRGYRIELGEIESALLQHDAISEAVVIATGEAGEEKRLVAYLAPSNGAHLDLGRLRSYLKEKLPDYMAPAAFVQVEKLPLTPNGKLDRNALPEPWQERGDGEKTYVAPQTPVEEMVVGIFEELLRLDRVGIHDDFFESGGHSLLAIQLISRVRNAFEIEVGIRSVFEAPTAKGLAGRIEEAIKAGEKDATPPLVKVEREGQGELRLPLSFAQQRLWFIDQLEPGNTAYNIPGAMRLEGRLDLEALEKVISEIVRRHETLRTRFEAEDGVPVQVIDEWKPWKLEIIDLRSLPLEEREAEVERRKREEAKTGFDLSKGPLLRVKAFMLEEERYLALFSMHHIISDGWSMGILIKEVGALYQAYIAGSPSPLPELKIQYADYTVWQRQWLQGEVLEKQLAYWKRQLAGAPPLLQLPTDRPRPDIPNYNGAYESFVLSAELSESLKRLSRDTDVTLFMSLLAVFQLLLARYSGQDRIVVGTPVAGRNRKETEGLIGFFVNTLVMVTDLSGNPTARMLLRRVREAAIGAFMHQDLPFEKLVEEIQPERDLSRQPLFQVMFTFQNRPEGSPVITNLRGGSDQIEIEDAKFEISFAAEENHGRITGYVEYARDIYERESMSRLLEHFERLLEGITADPECRALDLPLLSEAEWEQVLSWNRTAEEHAAEKLTHQLFEEQADCAPDRIGVVAEGEEISYGELNRRANQLGNYLRRRGIGPEIQVGICLERGVEMLVSLLAILKAGGAYVPLDPEYPAERLNFMLEDTAAPLIVTQEKLRATLGVTHAELICIDSDHGAIVLESPENIESGARGENLTYVIYTSGSTGRPKGAMITHRSAVNLVTDAVRNLRLERDSRFLQFASLSFDVAVEEIYPVWSIGGAVVLLSDNLSYSYSDLTESIERHGVTTIELPTAYWREWMRELLRVEGRAPQCLDLVITGDEKISAETFIEWKEHEVSLLHVYGVTEVTVNSMVYPVPGSFGEEGVRSAIPIGKPIANTEVYLLDERLRPTPLRMPGEMYLGGAGLARGYLNRPELTAGKFVPSPFGKRAGSRLYKSGDLARRSPATIDGCLEFIGRIDDQVKVRGYRVELGEIEAALKSHPMTEDAVVMAVEDGSGRNKLIAYVAPKYEYRQATDRNGANGAFVEGQKTGIPELWPACGEYGVFDDVLYYAMTNDQVRNNSYREAMRRLVKGKTVVDIGAGADAVLSRLCIEEGAKKVYAIETHEGAYQKAKREIEREGLEDKLILIHGESISVELPEKVDVCVSELIGTIGSAEGVVPILNDARRFLKDDGVMIPEKCVTKIAAVELPEQIRLDPAFTEMPGHYVNKVFEKMGRVFDLRLCVRNFPKRNLISSVDLFEELDFKETIEPAYQREICLRIRRNAKLEGLLLWINLETVEGEVVDILEYDGCFSPAYMPVFSPGMEVEEGDEIKAICSVTYRNERGKPDYQVKGAVIRRNGIQVEFDYHSRLEEKARKGNDFYRQLLPDEGVRISKKPEEILLPKRLKNHIKEILPAYMMPSSFVFLDSLPLSPNGKVDRRALPAPDVRGAEERNGYHTPRTPVEEIMIGIFQEVLKLDQVGRKENFFELGGHSLLATQVVSRVRKMLGVEIGLRSVFEKPTAEGLGRAVEEKMKAGEKLEAPPLVRVSRAERAPLSFAQQRLWFIDQLYPGSAVYNIPGAVMLEGALNLDALERSVDEIVRRHEVLRTRIEVDAGEPAQVIDQWESRKLEVVDLTSLHPKEKEAEVSRRAREERETGFDLNHGPLLRIKVLRLAEEDHVLLYTMHHIVSDEWSMGVLIRELASLYRAYSAGGEEAPLPELEIQYADFAIWQRAYLVGEVLDREIGYWREQLKDVVVLELPADRPRPAEPSYRGGVARLDLSRLLSEGLRRLSQREGVTLFMTLMAAFKALMMRYSRQEDISVGTVIANRTRREIEGLIGFFVNTLVMRTDLSGNPSFSELVSREREVALGAYGYQELPFEKLVEELNPQRDLSRSPLFQVMMVLEHAGREALELPGVKLSGVGSAVGKGGWAQAAQFDLTLSLIDLGRELAGAVEYSLDLFDAGTIERMIDHYTNLLNEIVKDSERPISELNLLSEQEREQVILGWNQTTKTYPEDQCVHHLFERQTERAPEAVAVVSDEGCLSYGELNRRANQLARHLRGLGVGPESVIGVCLERSVEMLIGLLGALKAGAAYLPLDPEYPPDRLSFMSKDAAARLIVTQKKLEILFRTTPVELVCIDVGRGDIARESEANIDSEANVENLAYVIYTSGSTGRPKGTMVAHRSMVNLVSDAVGKFRLGPQSRFLQFASLSFDVAVEEIFPVLSIGGIVVLLPDEESYSFGELTETIKRNEITTVEMPTVYWREWMRELLKANSRAPRCLDLVITGDERITTEVFREWKQHEVSLLHVYGVTEVTVNSIIYQVPEDFGEGVSLAAIPIGRPIANTEVYLLDERLDPMPLGIPGEAYLAGVGVSRGYLNRPEMTAERFVPSPFGKEAGSRLYRSGDLARASESGWIEFIGRADEQVKLRGYRIELGEIEARLALHPEIREAVAQVREDYPGDKRLVAYYTVDLTDGLQSSVDAETLSIYLSSALPAYMIPSAYVELDSLPLTPNGKLDRRALPPPDDAGAAREYEAPVGEIETTLARIWAKELNLGRVGRHDNFFTLGGHSLLALKLIERMRSEGLQSDVRTLFANPTPAEYAAAIEDMEVVL